MKKDQIKVGGTYHAKVGGKLTKVRVDGIRGIELYVGGMSAARTRTQPRFDCTNLSTGRKVVFKSPLKFIAEVA